MDKLATALGIEVAMLVRAFRQTEEGKHPGGEDLVKKLFFVRKKTYKYGSVFTGSDWTVICRTCNWIQASGGFQQADAEMTFRLACKQEKASKDKKEASIWKPSSYGLLFDEMARRKGTPALEAIGDLWRVVWKMEEGGLKRP
jgi:hypothetical protein